MSFDANHNAFRLADRVGPWVLAALLSFVGLRAAAGVWRGPEGSELPFNDFTEVEEFLQTARIEKARVLSSGVTRPIKLGLVKDGVRMNAVVRHVNVFRQRWDSPHGIKLNFRDSYLFECASYRLGRLLGIDNIPPVVEREVEGRKGTLQVWVEGAMTEVTRKERGLEPPEPSRWMFQYQVMWLFDNLIFNDDRNKGNILITRAGTSG